MSQFQQSPWDMRFHHVDLLKTFFLSFLLAPLDIAAVIAKLVVADTVVVKIRADVVHRSVGDVVQRLFCHEK